MEFCLHFAVKTNALIITQLTDSEMQGYGRSIVYIGDFRKNILTNILFAFSGWTQKHFSVQPPPPQFHQQNVYHQQIQVGQSTFLNMGHTWPLLLYSRS